MEAEMEDKYVDERFTPEAIEAFHDVSAQEGTLEADMEAFAQALGEAFSQEFDFITLTDKDGTAWSKAGRGIMAKMGLEVAGWSCPKDLPGHFTRVLTAGFTPCDECVPHFTRSRVT